MLCRRINCATCSEPEASSIAKEMRTAAAACQEPAISHGIWPVKPQFCGQPWVKTFLVHHHIFEFGTSFFKLKLRRY